MNKNGFLKGEEQKKIKKKTKRSKNEQQRKMLHTSVDFATVHTVLRVSRGNHCIFFHVSAH